MSDEEIDQDVTFQEIRTKLQGLNDAAKGKAVRRISALFSPEMEGDHAAGGSLQQATAIYIDRNESKLPRFSGAEKLGSGEVNFVKWHRAANRLLSDDSISDNTKKSIIFRSLTGLAEDIADLHRERTPAAIVDLVKVQFGGLCDGEDLLIAFHQHNQQPNESSTDYLSALFVELGEVLNSGGINSRDMPKLLLKQFIRGSSDEDLITKLRLDDRLDNPPAFPEFIGLVRKEESRRTEKRLRAKKLARSHQVAAAEETEVDKLRKEMAELKLQLTSAQQATQTHQCQQVSTQPRTKSFFCFRCGGDAHYAFDCANPPNKQLVQQKSEEAKNRRFNKHPKN